MKAIAYAEALAAVLARCAPLPAEPAPFHALAGRVLAEDARAALDEPPAAKSTMDGYALRSAETVRATAAAPAAFAFSTVVGAGHVTETQVAPGQAVRIMTGAWLPAGADAVVKQEDTQPLGEGRFAVTAPLRAGENVIGAGAILRAEQLLLGAGEVVTPQGVALLAGQGHAEWPVRRRPRVALLALGDELVEPGRPLAPGQLYVSTLYTLAGLCARYGAEPRRLGIAGDDPARIEALLRGCLAADGAPPEAACDVLVTLGGSHQGDFDFADTVLARLGAALHFRRTRISMGGSTLFATRGETLFFGLPGTPMAAWAAFEVLVRPALWKVAGRRELERPRVPARLTAAPEARRGRTNLVPMRLEFPPDDAPHATPLTRGSPMAQPASVLANGLLHWPEDEPAPPAGAVVPVEWLGEE